MLAERRASLESVLGQLVDRTGVEPGDLREDHGRWAVYAAAGADRANDRLLLECVRLEEDQALASALVVKMLGQVAAEVRQAWVDRLPQESRAFAQTRASELNFLDRIRATVLTAEDLDPELDGASTWLQ